VVRLTGTNEKEGQEILRAREDLIAAASMSEAAQKAIAMV
jgi:succinyl-CoA synthetase beta subunit